MTEKLATLKTDGDVSIITLDDGKANVFSLTMSQRIENLLDEVPEDKGALLLIGKPGMFSAGFDLKVMSSGDGAAVQEMVYHGALWCAMVRCSALYCAIGFYSVL